MVIGDSFPSFSYQPLFDTVAEGRLGCNSIAHSSFPSINVDIDQYEDQMHVMSWAVALIWNNRGL